MATKHGKPGTQGGKTETPRAETRGVAPSTIQTQRGVGLDPRLPHPGLPNTVAGPGRCQGSETLDPPEIRPHLREALSASHY